MGPSRARIPRSVAAFVGFHQHLAVLRHTIGCEKVPTFNGPDEAEISATKSAVPFGEGAKGAQVAREPRNVRILRTTPAVGWKAVYAVRMEDDRTKLEEERLSAFAFCEDEEGNRFVSGLGEGNELVVLRDDFVGHFSVKEPRYKIQEAVGRFARAREQEEGI